MLAVKFSPPDWDVCVKSGQRKNNDREAFATRGEGGITEPTNFSQRPGTVAQGRKISFPMTQEPFDCQR